MATTKEQLIEQVSKSVEPKQPDQWDYLRTQGWDEEKINTVKNPSPGLNMIDIFRQTTKKPDAPDEKQFKRNETMAAIGQGLGTLAEIYASSRGANVQRRDTTSPVNAINDRAEMIRQIYQQKLDSYNQGEQTAMVKDKLLRQQKEENLRTDADKAWYSYQTEERRKAEQEAKREQSLKDRKDIIDYQSKKKPKTEKEPKITPQQEVSINADFQNIPVSFLKSKGYTEEVVVDNTDPKTSRITPKVKKLVTKKGISSGEMKALVEEYNKQAKPAAQEKPKSTYQPPYMSKKTIPGF